MSTAAAPGKVLNRAALDPPRGEYDFVIIGGGLLGVACAWFLREFAPERSVLLVEAGGIPSEEGGTHVCPALHHHLYPDPEERARARWLTGWLETLARGGEKPLFARVGFLRPAGDGEEDAAGAVPFAAWREGQPENVRRNVDTLFGFADEAPVVFDPDGGHGNAEALALRLGHAGVGRGLDLMLNARAAFDGPATLRLDRLEMNNRMQVEVVRQTTVRAGSIVVACGAAGARLVAEGWGEALPPGFGRFFAQYPRFENDADLRRDARGVTEMPVVAARRGGFTIRPHGDGALLVPALPTDPDPEGYAPVGGKLFGVGTGLRGELLAPLVAALEELPALGRPSLNLGKTVANVRGAWETLTPAGRPAVWQHPGGAPVRLLAGGAHGFSLGIAAACELAHRLSGTDTSLPWPR